MAAWRAQPQDRYAWIAEADGAVVGIGELRTTRQQGEISYVVHIKRWGEGIATAIATMLLEYAFEDLKLRRVVATCDPRNVASEAVLKKIGMIFEGRLRHTIKLRDGWRDSNVYSMLSTEWADATATNKHSVRRRVLSTVNGVEKSKKTSLIG